MEKSAKLSGFSLAGSSIRRVSRRFSVQDKPKKGKKKFFVTAQGGGEFFSVENLVTFCSL